MRESLARLLSIAFLVAAPNVSAQADDGEINAHLRALETGRRGGEMRVRLELSWPGRPELHLVSAPSIEVPANGALRAGLSRSRFDGTATRWSHDAIVTLPGSSGPWTVGPARVTVRNRDGTEKEVVAAAIRTGRPNRNAHLLRQATRGGEGEGAPWSPAGRARSGSEGEAANGEPGSRLRIGSYASRAK